jgi:DNA-binding response OmpR family regulator
MVQEKILIIEDDKHISKLITYNLEKAGYSCSAAVSGEGGLKLLHKEACDLLLLDIMLPGMDGFEICRTLKQHDKLRHLPVVILTARGEETDRIVGLELGADDYIVKPFSPRELILRIKAILRRGKIETEKKDVLRDETLLIDMPKHKVTIHHKEIELAPMEFKLLATLIERRGRVQTREKLLSDVWSFDALVDTRTIDTHIKRLRGKIGKYGDRIETVRGLGYRYAE